MYESVIQSRDKSIDALRSQFENAETERKEAMGIVGKLKKFLTENDKKLEEKGKSYTKLRGKYERLKKVCFLDSQIIF